ncbi:MULTISPECIES: hypothetical protein [unclassified Winogradskyella]|uniref:hypothetical protein n=1 Tax=unclassified Winogradskyella TaxID=2615021 RepID=UPI00121828B3|nr:MULTISPECIES: hypothetical protein [unclassified Winogradskyella]RZN84364.1 MAG: hypothetical protein EVB12_00310 [Winogradskyella sp.]
MRKALKNCLFFILFSSSLFSQNKRDYSQNALAEKIYLQLGHKIYTTNKTVWIKAILANAATHSTELSSGVLYVDLINFENEIVESKIIKIFNGVGQGYFDLDRSYKNGTYQIRAYTEWNKNFGHNFVTKKEISIVSEISTKPKSILKNEIEIRKNRNTKKDSIVLKFFPEGGKIIANLKNRIGFRASKTNGKGIFIKGKIIDNNGKVITNFESNNLGLGSFILPKVSVSEIYQARLQNPEKTTVYQLPEIHSKGHLFSVTSQNDFILATVKHNKNLNTGIKLSVTLRGKTYFKKEVTLIQGRYIFSLPKSLFPEGVLEIKLHNQSSIPVAERLYFNNRKSYRLNLDSKITNTQISKRDKVDIILKTKNQRDSIVETNSSVLVLNKNLYGEFESIRENILTYFLLSSEIRGKIEKASSYFKQNTNLNIDDLMLTQGWRNYKYSASPKKLLYSMESGLQIRGVINKINPKAKFNNLDILLMTFGDDSSVYTGKVDVPSNFNFQIDDLYGGERKLVLKPSGISEKESKYYKISLTKKKVLKPNFIVNEIENFVVKNDSLVNIIIEINENQKRIENKYFTDITGVNQLDEVIIDAYKMTPKRKEVFDKYGKPDVVIDGKEINKKTNKYSRGLYSNLIGFHEKVFIRKDSLRNYYAETTNGGKGHVNMVLVDGIAVIPDDYLLIQRIDPKEVTSFEIIDNPSRARQLYATIYGTYPYGEFQSSIISIHTNQGKGLFGALDVDKKFNVQTIEAFSIEKEFYVPNYSDDFARSLPEPDFRSTIYWNPNIINKKGEPINISFSHSDDSGDFLVIIESISKDGKIGYKTLEYNVSETED